MEIIIIDTYIFCLVQSMDYHSHHKVSIHFTAIIYNSLDITIRLVLRDHCPLATALRL